MSDPLSAISLLLTVFTVVFGLWQPKAAAALAIKPQRYRASRNEQISAVAQAHNLMLALLTVSLAIGSVFMPRALTITSEALTQGGAYDDLKAVFLVAETLLLALFIAVGWYVARLRQLLAKLNSDAEIDPDAV